MPLEGLSDFYARLTCIHHHSKVCPDGSALDHVSKVCFLKNYFPDFYSLVKKERDVSSYK